VGCNRFWAVPVPRSQEHQVAGNNFRAIFPLPALPIFRTRGLNLSLDVKLGTFGYVFADNLCQALPGDDVVPFSALLEFTVLILKALIGGKAELSNRDAARWYLISGSLPTLPTRITLFTLYGIAALL
jgi:hypothetical protein